MKLLTHEMKQYNYDCSAEDWKEFINKMDNREVVKIDEEMFYYWLWTKEQIKRMTKQDFLYFIKVLVSTYGKSLNDINIILDC